MLRQSPPNLFCINSVEVKLAFFNEFLNLALLNKEVPRVGWIPLIPGRDAVICKIRDLPPKPKLNSCEGQARLIHDVASIELQAMELALRTLWEFPIAPELFRNQLAQIAVDEARHLRMCLDGLKTLGFQWGHWPVHTTLWESVSAQDSLLERVFIVHRYLEGGGLDAGHSILNRLGGVEAPVVKAIFAVISNEEIAHVAFGSRWFRILCAETNRDSEAVFSELLEGLRNRLPRRLEVPSEGLRKEAGFSQNEIEILKDFRNRLLASYQTGPRNKVP